MDTDILTPDQVAQYLGVTQHTLAVWRCEGRYNLPYIKIGRLVRYERSAVRAFLSERKQAPSTPASAATA